jgi:hypothetical protein
MLRIIIIIIIISFMQGIHTYIPETNHVSSVYSVAAILCILFYYYYLNFSLLSFSWEIFTYPGMYHQQD